jgi:hypothetical protein
MMAKTSDILKELEDIGALGNKILEPVIRRPAPIMVLPAFESRPLPPSAPQTREVLVGFAEQLENLEAALQGMLEWCATARSSLLSQEAAELEANSADLGDEEQEAESDSDSTEDPSKEIEVPAVSPETSVVRPKLSLAEIRKHFLDPKFEPEEPRVNGTAHVEAAVVPTPSTEKADE